MGLDSCCSPIAFYYTLNLFEVASPAVCEWLARLEQTRERDLNLRIVFDGFKERF